MMPSEILRRPLAVILSVFLMFSHMVAQTPADSVAAAVSIPSPYRFRPLGLAIPATLIAVGFIGLESDWLKGHNTEVRDELQEHSHPKVTVDDFTQYVPLAATYGLNLCGVKGLHGYADLTIIAATTYLLAGASVYATKTLTRVERPDGSARNSFPSGHTATAFAGAELLRKEYWHVSPWIGAAGYLVAAGSGFFQNVQQPALVYRRDCRCRIRHFECAGVLLALSLYFQTYISQAIYEESLYRPSDNGAGEIIGVHDMLLSGTL